MAEADASLASSHDEGSDEAEDAPTVASSSGTATATATATALMDATGGGGEGRKRKRLSYQKTSCELCKARKVKCDRAEPACSWCAQHHRTCVYLERQKPGSRLLLGSELEAKVNRLEALLQSLGRRVEEHIAGADASNGHPSAALGESNRAASTPPVALHHHHQEEVGRAMQQLPLPLPLPPLSAIGSGTSSYPLSMSSLPEPRRLSAINDFPPHDIVYAIVDLYFKHCNPWCPVLDRKTVFGTFFGSTSFNEPDRVLLHAIIATTLRFLKDPRLSPEMKAHHHAVSKHAVQTYTLEHISVASLRALVILSLDELGSSNGPKGWNMLSLLAQNVRHLGLCSESGVYLSQVDSGQHAPHAGPSRRVTAGRPESWIEDEGRRRLCWMVYLLDRYTTISTPAFDFLIDDAAMRRVLPCSYDLFSRDVPVETRSWLSAAQPYGTTGYAASKPENLGSFSYHCEILRILSKVHDFVRRPLDVSRSADLAAWRSTYRLLNAALDGWLGSLPSDYSKISALCHSDPGSRVANWFMLHGAYVTAVVRLHSSAAYPSSPCGSFRPSYYAMQRCLSAVQSLADITGDVFEASGLDSLGPPFVFALWVAARLLLVHAAATEGVLDAKVDFFMDILSHIGQYWEIASHYSRILARAVQRSRQGDTSLTAMRRHAHDLAALTLSTRMSSLEPTVTQAISPSEIDSLDIFDFFNVPKLTGVLDGDARMARTPDPGDDWLSSPFN